MSNPLLEFQAEKTDEAIKQLLERDLAVRTGPKIKATSKGKTQIYHLYEHCKVILEFVPDPDTPYEDIHDAIGRTVFHLNDKCEMLGPAKFIQESTGDELFQWTTFPTILNLHNDGDRVVPCYECGAAPVWILSYILDLVKG